MNETLSILNEILSPKDGVSFKEFVESPDYCNNKDMYGFWEDNLGSLSEAISELLIGGSIGGGKCISGESIVLTSLGLRRVKDLFLQEGTDKTVVLDRSVLVEGNVEEVPLGYLAGKKDSIILHISDGEVIEVSPEHKFKVWNNSHAFTWKEAKDIVEGDLLKVDLTILPLNKVSNPQVFRYDTIREHIRVSEEFVIDEDFGYFMGLLAGDGCYTSCVRFESGDLQLLDWVENYTGKKKCKLKNKELYDIYLDYMIPAFKHFGIFGQDSCSKQVPSFIMNAPFSVQVAFIQGLMDTDGTSDTRGHCELELNSKYLIHFAKLVANGLGLESRIRNGHSSKSFRLRFSSSQLNRQLFRLTRKRERIKDSYHNGYAKGITITGLWDYINSIKRERNIKLTREQHKCIPHGNITIESLKYFKPYLEKFGLFDGVELDNATLARVDKIEYGSCEMYDLTNPTSHSYRMNGFVTHNSYSCNYYLAYRIYRLFLKGSPQLQLGLAEDSEIFCFYFTVSLELAKQSGFTHLQSIFKNCKWFKENAPVNENLKSIIEFQGRNFYIKAGSDFGHQLGLNVFAFILDEANFREGVGIGMAKEYEEVTFLYQTLLDRQLSRLSTPDGRINALAILISSASYQTSFMEKRKEAIKGDPNAKFINAVAYEIRPEKYSKEKFEVFIGCGSVEPCLVSNEEHKKKLIRSAGIEGSGQEEFFFRKVPMNLHKQFVSNIVLALQNHCGVSTLLQGSFMLNMKFLQDSYVGEDVIPLVFQSETLEASTADDTQLIEYLIPENIQYPDRPHSLFLDASIQGDTASLVCYRYDAPEDMHTKVFDLKIVPPPFPAATRLSKLQNLIIDLSQYIYIVALGSDQYQCLGPNTLIPTILGIKRISEIEVGDKVFCKSGVCNVLNKFHYSNVETVDLITKRGHVINCTRNHRLSFLTRKRKSELHLASESLGRRLENAPGFLFHAEAQFIEGEEVTPEFAEYIGWMTGDGGISNGVPYLVASYSERDIILCLERRLHEREIPKYWNHTKKISLPLLKGSFKKCLVKYFGRRYAAEDKHVPEFIFKSPKKVVDSYLRGLYSADGSCTKEQVVLTSVSKKLLEDVRVLLSVYYGIKSQITRGKRGYSYDYKNSKDVYHLRTVGSTKRFIEIGFWQEHKMKNLIESFKVVGKGYADYVEKIVASSNTEVYDLEVDSEDHTYYLWDTLTHNSSQIRQEVQQELGIDDIRVSIDSSDIPHNHWVRGLVEHKIRQRKSEYLEREVTEAVHDYAKHRVLKAKGSTDDDMQANVGAYFLSSTFGKNFGSISDLYPERINLVGGKSIDKVLRELGYSDM